MVRKAGRTIQEDEEEAGTNGREFEDASNEDDDSVKVRLVNGCGVLTATLVFDRLPVTHPIFPLQPCI